MKKLRGKIFKTKMDNFFKKETFVMKDDDKESFSKYDVFAKQPYLYEELLVQESNIFLTQ